MTQKSELCYSELIKLPTFEERFEYLRLDGHVGEDTFGFDRYLNQKFYSTSEWRRVRDLVIVRDNGCDLGIEGRDIFGRIYIHHMNPICKDDIISHSTLILEPEYLICVTFDTHNAIHYSNPNQLIKLSSERKPNDTCPWKR